MRPDMFLMRGGRMMLLRSGDMIVLEENVTMADGTKVMTDGTIILMDGTTLTLAEDEGMITESPMAVMERTDI